MHKLRFWAEPLAVLCVLGVSAFGQTNFGRISGTVLDPSGAAVPGAKALIRDVDTQATRAVLTDANGFYVAQNLPIGPYSVTVQAPGFKSASRNGLNLVADGRITANFQLELGQSTQTVDVVAAAADQLNTVS